MLWNLALRAGKKFVNHKYDISNCRSWKLGEIWSQNCNVVAFYEICQSEQIEYANYEYIYWNWLPDHKFEICEIWSQNWNVLQFSWNLALRAKLNMLIMNVTFGIDYLEPRL